MESHCRVQIDVVDVNDNSPEIILTSEPQPVREDSPSGTVVALLNARDADSSNNSKVTLKLPKGSPFTLKPSFSNNYALVTSGVLDRETFSEYNIEITATDSGSPPLSSKKTIPVTITDVNDNPPVFTQPSYNVYLKENGVAGSILYSVSASDLDFGENAKISYSILDSKVQDVSVSSYVYINSDNGSIYSMHSFDYEKLKVFQIQVQAKDQGSPSLSSNATVHVFILDQNDNAPAVIYPSSAALGSLSHQRMPRSAKAGHLVTKVTAVDADSGHNAWISYKLAEATDASLFTVNLYTGEVRTKRAMYEQDDSSQRLLIEVKDDGEPVQSATVTVSILLEDGLHEPILDLRHKTIEPSKKNGRITLYLILSLASVSVLSLVTFLILAVKCIRNSRSSGSCCIRRSDCDDYKNPNRNLQIQLNTDGPIKYVEVLGGDMLSQSQSFRSCMSPMSEYSDFTLIKPSSTTDFKEVISVLDASLPDSTWTFESQQPSYNVYLKENGVAGSILYSVSASDLDFGENAKISYSILDSKVQDVSVSSYVYINSDNGSIYSMHSFDYEKLKVFQIQVQAKDQGSPSLSSNATVHVFILDQNDNAPAVIYPSSAALGSLSHQRMPRSAKAGHLVTKVTAVDADSGHNAWVSYKLAEATDVSLFTVNLYTGEVRTKRAVYEQDDSSQRLLIEVRDDGEPVQSATVTVSILLEDGLHEPILDLRHKTIEPSKKNGRITLYLILSLASVSVLSLVTFLILAVKCIRNSRSSGSCCIRRSDCDDYKNPNRNLQIQLNTDGPIKYVEVLGGDMLSQSQSFRSCMSPMSEYSDFTLIKPSSTTDFKEVISVLDASLPDSTWTFESQQPSYNVYLKENGVAGSILYSVSASDLDFGENAKISYSILDSKVQDVSVSSYVYINSDNGSIYSMHSFDYEKLKVFQIQIQAKDQGSPSLSSNATVHVFILDQNDNAPAVIYPSSAALGSLSHQRMPRSAKAGHLVTKVTAVDADSGHNAWISYKLAEATDVSLFTVNLYTGEVRTKRAVSEQDDSSQRLLIEVKDDGEPVQSATVTVSILLEDGLHEPILDLRHKTVEPNKKNGRITLYLILSLASVSVLSLVTFLILAVKCIRNSRSSGSCCIRRSDCDDYKNPNRNLQIQLNTDGPIKYVEVLGGDMLSQSQSFRSCMSPMSEYSDFTLIKPSSTTDFKEVISVLDASLPDSTWTFESQQKSQLGVKMDFRAESFSTTKMDSDSRPQGTRYSIPEELKQGSVVGNLAKDLGLGLSEIFDRKLRVASEAGEITLKGELDYETTKSYDIDVTAKDKGSPEMEGHCRVQVDIIDFNDNVPDIVLTSQPKPVREDAESGTVVALISARDLDSGDNGKVTLQLTKGSPFNLKPSFSNNYALVTSGGLDRETCATYDIEITATDSGSPPLSSKKTIPVTITDVNDNPPVFTQPSYNVYLKENGVAGSILYSVSASDLDFGENAKISYSILDSKVQDVSVSSYVYINSDNGSIYSMHSFDYEKLKVFQIQVQAKDQGSPSLSSNATVHVFILDQNDNAPAVIYPSSAALGSLSHQRMPRSAKAGHLVTKVTAVDADSGHNAWISYKLAEASDVSLFTVNLYTGEVRTKRAVYEQDDSSQRLLIEVKDDGEPVQSATVTVSILLEDGLHEPILDLRHKTIEPNKKNGRITLYLILSLASVSVLSLVTFLILAVKCIRNSRSSGSCCIRRSDCDDYKNPNRNLQIQLNTDGPIKYVEVLGGDMLSQSQSFRSCMSPMSEYSDFTLIKPSSTTDFKEVISVLDASLPDSTWTFESQQVSRPSQDTV
ncbi:hypothetical protein PAMA_017341 [Pampus argenteus]